MTPPDYQFDAIKSDFVLALKVLRDVIQHVVEASLPPNLRVVILNNTIVALTAAVEETLRDLFKEYLAILEDNIVDHRTLRADLQNSNFECGLQILKGYKKNGGLASVTSIVNNMDKCLNGIAGYNLLKDELVYNQANFKSTQVTDVAKSVGINNFWNKVCECAEIENYTSEANVDTRVTKIINKWNEVFDERNLVVHRVSQASGWGADRIYQAISLAEIVVVRMSGCLSDDVERILQP